MDEVLGLFVLTELHTARYTTSLTLRNIVRFFEQHPY